MRTGSLATHRDCALALGVNVDKRPPLRFGAPHRLNAHPEGPQLSLCAVAEVVVTKRGEEEAFAGKARELHCGDGSATGWFYPMLEGVNDLTWLWDGFHPCELGPLHMPDDGNSHRAGSLARARPARRVVTGAHHSSWRCRLANRGPRP